MGKGGGAGGEERGGGACRRVENLALAPKMHDCVSFSLNQLSAFSFHFLVQTGEIRGKQTHFLCSSHSRSSVSSSPVVYLPSPRILPETLKVLRNVISLNYFFCLFDFARVYAGPFLLAYVPLMRLKKIKPTVINLTSSRQQGLIRGSRARSVSSDAFISRLRHIHSFSGVFFFPPLQRRI